MKFIFSGTGTSQGIPVIACPCAVCQSADTHDNRLRTSGVLMSDTTTVVFDTGPDFRQQMLRHRVQQLDAVVFTHAHKDHTAGLDDVRSFNYRQQRPMPLWGNAGTLHNLRREYYYVFENENYPGLPLLSLHEVGQAPFTIGDLTLTPVPVKHGRMEVLGFRCGDFAYITDANDISPASLDLLQGLDTLVLNALRVEKHHSHFSLDEALAVIASLNPRQAWLTHISHQMGLHAETSARLPAGVAIAWDGLTLSW
ncbi:MAG: MBL fold metallo-hydrolase [Bacteroidia bacterium]|nr:MBL fold metallo-hydrolase [Bacteroidia bacterium]